MRWHDFFLFIRWNLSFIAKYKFISYTVFVKIELKRSRLISHNIQSGGKYEVRRRRMTKTLEYYNQCAQVYNETTLNIEFEKKREFLLKYLKPKAHILDLGCGSGRDSKAFLQQGYEVTAMDGSQELCKIASENTGQEVRCQLFHELADIETYDGVWACASLLHLPTVELKETLKKVARALKNEGYFYASFKYGEFEGYREERFFNDFTEDSFKSLLTEIPNLIIIEMEVTTDVIPGRENVSWLNIIMKKKYLDLKNTRYTSQ